MQFGDDDRGGLRPSQRRPRASIHDNNSSADVIPHIKEKFDPDHPDADWGGFVQRSYKKKVFSDHTATRDNLTVDEKGGLMPDRAAPTVASSFSGKKMFEPHQVPMGDPSVSGIQFQSAVYQVGPGSDLSCRDWKTSYEAQTTLEAMPKDTYALGSQRNVQHKRHVVPMYEKALLERKGSGRIGSPSGLDNNAPTSRGSSPSGLVGTERRLEPRKSLLAGIGKLVAAEDVDGKLARPELHLSTSYSDPANKTLIADNHHPMTLGYTGRKSSFRR